MSLKRICAIVVSFFVFLLPLKAAEIRALCSDTEIVKEKMLQKEALFLGEYAFTDFIYKPICQTSLDEEFVRIRCYQKTRWQQKTFVIVHKKRNRKEGVSKILFQDECDMLEEAIKMIPQGFFEALSFSRCGWEYSWRNMRLYIEEIEDMPPSIEVIAPSREEILELFKNLNVTEVLRDSVPTYISKKKNP